MEKNLHYVFEEAISRPDASLSEKIWARILAIEERQRRLTLWAYACIGVFSFTALFPVINNLLTQFTQSGFYEYVSLIFSDSASVHIYWKELALSIADALPGTSLLLSLSLLIVFLVSLKRVARRLKTPLKTPYALA